MFCFFFFFQAEDGIRDGTVTGVQTCALPISHERTITITGRTVVPPRESFVIVLRGTPSGSGVNLTGGTVRIGRPWPASGYSGPVAQLSGKELFAAVSGQAGKRQARFTMTINGSAVTGTVSIQAASGE